MRKRTRKKDTDEKRIRITRTLVMEGPESWIRQTLAFSTIDVNRPLLYGRAGLHASILEVSRVEARVHPKRHAYRRRVKTDKKSGAGAR